jgi:hypothetical protein
MEIRVSSFVLSLEAADTPLTAWHAARNVAMGFSQALLAS